MTDKTDCRMAEVLRRAKKRRRAQENYLLAGLSFVCIALLGSFTGTIAIVTDIMPQSNIVMDAYGTVILHSGASVYVLVGLLAFVAGVVITVLCFRTQHKNNPNKTNQNKE
ncbi:MAG: hypothetical protein RSJ40_07190 [Acetivibrio sp.]